MIHEICIFSNGFSGSHATYMTHTSKTGAHAILTGSEAFWQSTFLNPQSSHQSFNNAGSTLISRLLISPAMAIASSFLTHCYLTDEGDRSAMKLSASETVEEIFSMMESPTCNSHLSYVAGTSDSRRSSARRSAKSESS